MIFGMTNAIFCLAGFALNWFGEKKLITNNKRKYSTYMQQHNTFGRLKTLLNLRLAWC